MNNYKRRILNQDNKINEKQKEEKTNKDNINISSKSKLPNNDSSSTTKRYRYRRFYVRNKSKEEKISENNNDNNDDLIINKENISNNFVTNSKKEEILKKLKDIVPIIEDKEGEENITPNKGKINYDRDAENNSVINNMLRNEFQIENEQTNKQLKKSVTGDLRKKYYDNELIDAILDVEKYNVDKYLSKDLALIYNDISKDNLFFKNNVFLGNVDYFERKTGNLDKKKNNNINNNNDIEKKLKEIPKTNEIIDKFTEKSKIFK